MNMPYLSADDVIGPTEKALMCELKHTHNSLGQTMKYIDYKCEIEKAKRMVLERPDYWLGYKKGLSRQYFGDEFSTKEEHRAWLKKINSSDRFLREQGKGYFDGVNFK
jgi:hypothetical protein